jgi:hypothetical protein
VQWGQVVRGLDFLVPSWTFFGLHVLVRHPHSTPPPSTQVLETLPSLLEEGDGAGRAWCRPGGAFLDASSVVMESVEGFAITTALEVGGGGALTVLLDVRGYLDVPAPNLRWGVAPLCV